MRMQRDGTRAELQSHKTPQPRFGKTTNRATDREKTRNSASDTMERSRGALGTAIAHRPHGCAKQLQATGGKTGGRGKEPDGLEANDPAGPTPQRGQRVTRTNE